MKSVKGRGRFLLGPSCVLAWMLLVWSPSVFGLNPTLDVSQYAHTSWKIREGLSKGIISSIAQTPDGYLWLGAEFGLLRFDGVRAVPWQPPPDQHLPSSNISSLLAAHDGTLWIGTYKGLASWKGGKLTAYPELAGQLVPSLVEDHEGTIWAGTLGFPAGRLCAIQKNGVRCYGEDGTLGRGVLSLYEDSKANLWVGVMNGLWRWKPGLAEFYSLPAEGESIQGLVEDHEGALLFSARSGIKRIADGKIEAYPLPGNVREFRPRKILRDRDGGLWIGTSDKGLVHVHRGRTDVFAQSGGLSGDGTYALFEDREGNIWLATNSGLDRFREFAVTTFSVNQGLSSAVVNAVLVDRSGSVWMSTFDALNTWDKGQITISHAGGKPDGRLNGLAPNSLFQDSRGRLWISTNREFGYTENNRFIPVRGIPGGPVHGIAEDLSGNLWIANQDHGLFRLSPRTEVQQTPWASLGHNVATAVVADPLRDGLWLGFYQGGVAYFSDGQVRASYTAADGLGEGNVIGFQIDQDGTLWIATEGGLSRLKNGRIVTLTARNGLPCDAVHWVIEDNAHSFWLLMACGLVRIARSELDAWAAAAEQDKDTKRTIQRTVFDSFDGVASRARAGGDTPLAAKSLDGKLWFISVGGVSVVDPHNLPFNALPPPVQIEQFIADHKTYDATSDANQQLHLPPLVRDLEIDYTALSLLVQEKVLFRYMLEGWDHDWQDVGDRRRAFYNNLPPANYRFRVTACNNSGVWNEAGTFLDFAIAPAYYQTTWFRLSFVAAFLILLAALYQVRVRQVARQVRARMEERLDERERIARDLHDTLLQSVQGLILKFHAVANQIPRDVAAHDALEKTLDRADEVLAEGRDRVRNLRGAAESLGDLPAAFKRVAEDKPQGREATFKTVVEGSVRELHPLVLEESYCIGREALINALTHSRGLHVEVEITYDTKQFRLRVRDDGHGFDPKILEDGGRPDHWGLQGMRERSDRIGAQLKIWSGHETGTEVELIVPAATAYRVSAKPRSSWFRRSGVDGEPL